MNVDGAPFSRLGNYERILMAPLGLGKVNQQTSDPHLHVFLLTAGSQGIGRETIGGGILTVDLCILVLVNPLRSWRQNKEDFSCYLENLLKDMKSMVNNPAAG